MCETIYYFFYHAHVIIFSFTMPQLLKKQSRLIFTPKKVHQ